MKNPSPRTAVSRRTFLAAAGAAVALPTFIPLSALGRGRTFAPSDRVNLGVIGWGMQGPSNTGAFLQLPDCRVVAACDLDPNHRAAALKTINDKYGNKDCKGYSDYREMLARPDIDAIMMAVPDHWHALVAIEALNHKKDVYGEKPLAKTIAEQQAIVRHVEKNDCIWQMGSWQRSTANFHKAAEIVRNGYIGEVTHVEVGLPGGHTDFAGTAPALLQKLGTQRNNLEFLTKVLPGTPEWDKAVAQPPENFDYETWIGPSKMEPYIEARVHRNWRWNYNTGGGQLLDWISHHCDIAHWGLDFDNSGPSEIEGEGEFPAPNALWNTAGKYRIELKYPRNVKMIISGGHPEIREGTKWIGPDGWVYVNRGAFESSDPRWETMAALPENLRKVKLYSSTNHQKNFIDCVKSRQPTITTVQVGHHSAIPGHLSLISMRLGRKINWDAASERILHDADAAKLLSRAYRAPWKFPGSHEILRSPKDAAAIS